MDILTVISSCLFCCGSGVIPFISSTYPKASRPRTTHHTLTPLSSLSSLSSLPPSEAHKLTQPSAAAAQSFVPAMTTTPLADASSHTSATLGGAIAHAMLQTANGALRASRRSAAGTNLARSGTMISRLSLAIRMAMSLIALRGDITFVDEVLKDGDFWWERLDVFVADGGEMEGSGWGWGVCCLRYFFLYFLLSFIHMFC